MAKDGLQQGQLGHVTNSRSWSVAFFHKLDEIGILASVALPCENKRIGNKMLPQVRTELATAAIPV